MARTYQDYFGEGDINRGKARMMRDIEKHRLSGRELAGLIDELEKADLLTHKPFTPEPRERWNEEYLSMLSSGHISDYFSRGYLEHVGEVADCVSRKKGTGGRGRMPLAVLLAAAAVAIIAAALAWKLLSPKADACCLEGPAGSAPQMTENGRG